MTDEIVIDVSCLEHVYPGGTRVDICGVPFQARAGQRIAIMGPNGAGKSTLMKLILGLIKPANGRVSVFGKDPVRQYSEIRHRIGAVMQNVEEQLIGPTVFDDVAFAPLNFGFSKVETSRRVETILRSLGIYHLRDRLPHYLSGGERKKVALAGALVFGPDLLIMDEPLEGIDYASRCEITDYLYELHRQSGMTIICTIHNMDWVPGLADVGYLMQSSGRLDLYGTIQDLFFGSDLSLYNLAPPQIVRIIQGLRRNGIEVRPTLDVTELQDELTRMLRNGARGER